MKKYLSISSLLVILSGTSLSADAFEQVSNAIRQCDVKEGFLAVEQLKRHFRMNNVALQRRAVLYKELADQAQDRQSSMHEHLSFTSDQRDTGSFFGGLGVSVHAAYLLKKSWDSYTHAQTVAAEGQNELFVHRRGGLNREENSWNAQKKALSYSLSGLGTLSIGLWALWRGYSCASQTQKIAHLSKLEALLRKNSQEER